MKLLTLRVVDFLFLVLISFLVYGDFLWLYVLNRH